MNDRQKRLYYRSVHRGCKETDYILGNYAKAHIADLSSDELDQYEAFINEDDANIYKWTTGELEVPAEHDNVVVRAVLNFRLEN